MKKILLIAALALPLGACGNTGWGRPGSSWTHNIGKTAAAGAVVGGGVGLAVGGVGVLPGVGIGAASGAVVGATLPHSGF